MKAALSSLRFDGHGDTLRSGMAKGPDGAKDGARVIAFYTYSPSAPLSTHVDSFWLHEDNAQPYTLERALPTGKPGLWIELGGDGLRVATREDPRHLATFRTATLFGASSQWFIVAAGRHISRMGALFTPNGAAAFFAPPASELHNAHVPLDALWGDAAAGEFRERLLVETTPAARFQQLERLLLARLMSPSQHPAVAFAVDALLAAPQARTVMQVVDQVALSHQ
jgi:hypothetical protein